MVIEWLRFKVDPALRDRFIQVDDAIWTTALAANPGFLGKEVWLSPTQPDAVVLVIRWRSREDWKAVPAKILEKTENAFAQALGKGRYELVETGEYQVRKFPRTAP